MKILNELINQFKSKKRRELLVTEMQSKKAHGLNCYSCRGVCCTFEANSMQVTPLEALEIYQNLKENALWNNELENKLEQTIRHYRLDKEIPSTGKSDELFLRRTYTCPFFIPQGKGCTLNLWVKPYGCLGFNPNEKDIQEGGNCTSSLSLLEKREDLFEKFENDLNKTIRKELALKWEKLSIPQALLSINEQSCSD